MFAQVQVCTVNAHSNSIGVILVCRLARPAKPTNRLCDRSLCLSPIIFVFANVVHMCTDTCAFTCACDTLERRKEMGIALEW